MSLQKLLTSLLGTGVSAKMEKQVKAQGQNTERVYIDPDTFPDWCRREGVGVNREGRHKFVATAMAAKYANQS
jgi:hypothetical protein